MRKSTKSFLGGLALAAGALGAIGAVLMKKNRGSGRNRSEESTSRNVWARPGMHVTFRAEVMPGRNASERTFRVVKLLPSGRVLLEGAAGEHAEKEFEPVRWVARAR